jgi:hypothetical protein
MFVGNIRKYDSPVTHCQQTSYNPFVDPADPCPKFLSVSEGFRRVHLVMIHLVAEISEKCVGEAPSQMNPGRMLRLSCLPPRHPVLLANARFGDFVCQRFISPRLSCASTDGCSTESNVPLSTDPRPGVGCLEGCAFLPPRLSKIRQRTQEPLLLLVH